MIARRSRSAVGEPRLLLLPAWAWYVAFLAVPLAYMVVYSLAVNDPDRFFAIDFGIHCTQYAKAWDPLYLRVYRDTFVMAFTGTLGCLVIGYPFAYFLALRVRRHRSLLILLVVIPFWTSLLIRTYAWALILGESGALSKFLQRIGLLSQPLDVMYSSRAVWIGIVYDYLPLMVFPIYVALERMDLRLKEASRDLGAGKWATFRRVTLPMTLPGVLTGSLLTFIPMTGEYVVPQVLGGAKSFLVGSLVANQVLVGIDYLFGAALSMGLVVTLLIVILAYLRALGRRTEENLGAML